MTYRKPSEDNLTPQKLVNAYKKYNKKELFNKIKRHFICKNHWISKARCKFRKNYYLLIYEYPEPLPYEIIWINPDDIKKWLTPEKRPVPFFSKYGTYVIKGDWDINESYYNDVPAHRNRFVKLQKSLNERYNKGVAWEKTPIYEYSTNNDAQSRYNGPNSVNTQLNEIDRLYENMKENGYKTQRELRDIDNSPFTANSNRHPEIPNGVPPEFHEVGVAIGRDGDFYWCNDGIHRLLISKIAGVEKIAVRVVIRHSKWQKKREKIASSKKHLGQTDDIKKDLSHPDLKFLQN